MRSGETCKASRKKESLDWFIFSWSNWSGVRPIESDLIYPMSRLRRASMTVAWSTSPLSFVGCSWCAQPSPQGKRRCSIHASVEDLRRQVGPQTFMGPDLGPTPRGCPVGGTMRVPWAPYATGCPGRRGGMMGGLCQPQWQMAVITASVDKQSINLLPINESKRWSLPHSTGALGASNASRLGCSALILLSLGQFLLDELLCPIPTRGIRVRGTDVHLRKTVLDPRGCPP